MGVMRPLDTWVYHKPQILNSCQSLQRAVMRIIMSQPTKNLCGVNVQHPVQSNRRFLTKRLRGCDIMLLLRENFISQIWDKFEALCLETLLRK
jgi:hypothetical protein